MANNVDGRAVPDFRPEQYQFLRNQLGLDLLSLDDEVTRIPVLLQEAAEITAIAVEIREQAKEDLDRVCAEIGNYLRIPDDKGKMRSETQIGSMLAAEKDYIKATEELRQARLDAALWQALTEGLRVKSSAIKTAVDLIVSGWITSDSIVAKRRKDMRQVT